MRGSGREKGWKPGEGGREGGRGVTASHPIPRRISKRIGRKWAERIGSKAIDRRRVIDSLTAAINSLAALHVP